MIGKIRSLKAVPRVDSYHLLLTPTWEPCGGREALPGTGQRVTDTVAWPMWTTKEGVAMADPVRYDGPGQLATLLLEQAQNPGGLTVWLPRGWEDFVGTGLADVVDSGGYRYSWACLDGPRVIFSGRLGKRVVNVTSLSAWTGGAWDGWAEQAHLAVDGKPLLGGLAADAGSGEAGARDILTALGSVLIILGGCNVLGLGKPKLSIGAQARVWWQGWGGLTVRVARPSRGSRKRPKAKELSVLTLPMPSRPAVARGHEGHCCHGLAREQYYRGHVSGPVHVLDMASAYLVGLVASPLPAVYSHSPRGVAPAELAKQLPRYVGCALVRLRDCAWPYPVYRHDQPARAVGSYWAWLAGTELANACNIGAVAECHLAHLWHPARYDAPSAGTLMNVTDNLDAEGLGAVRPFWRALYAACVGGWAQRRWAWEDVDQPSQVGRWATWTMAGAEPDQLERWRVVAGRVQRRVYRGEAPHALPLAYACVVAAVRFQLDFARNILPPGSVLATACDALWITEEGRAAVERGYKDKMLMPSIWRLKDRYDDAWLDGRGGAVVTKGGYRYPLLPGVPHGVCLADDGRARWERATPWTDGIDGGQGEPRRRRVATWDGGALQARNSGPLVSVAPWITLHDADLPEALILPYDPSKARRGRKGGSCDV